MNHRFTNWAGTHTCLSKGLNLPQNTSEVLEAVKKARAQGSTLKAVGAGHSWSDIACTQGHMICLDRMNRVLNVDKDDLTVRVEAGIRLKHLIDELYHHGLALSNLGSVAEQSIAGAISTGTHGTGITFGNLSSIVRDFKVVTGQGKVLTKSDIDINAVALGLGALGIITELELAVEPAFDLKEERWAIPFDRCLDQMLDIVEEHEHVKFWWLPHTKFVVVFASNRTTERRTKPVSEKLESFLNDRVFAKAIEVGRRQPDTMPVINRAIAKSYFAPRTRVARSNSVFNLAMPPAHLESEYGIPMGNAPDFLREVRNAIVKNDWKIGFIQEVRFVEADQIWLSGAYERRSCQFGTYATENRDGEPFLRQMSCLSKDFGARPHWGKEIYATSQELRAVYPRLGDFAKLRQKHDPDGVFMNDFLRRTLH